MSGMPEIAFFPANSLPEQPWAAALHDTIIKAFKRKDIQAFPPSWTRLKHDPAVGIAHLAAAELGPHGTIAVLFINGQPVGCGGSLPFRGNDWISNEKSADATSGDIVADKPLNKTQPQRADQYELCCFCIHPDYRKQGLSRLLLDAIAFAVRKDGAKELVVNYSVEEAEEFWPRLGFRNIPGATSTLPKGFTHTVGMEGLREDIHFQIAVMQL
ncbi:hypothetical protein Q7P37_004555 [Cladosporium fusiforme]